MSDKNINNQENYSKKFDEMFQYNTTENVEEMNRDYLHQIYNDEMKSLNKLTLLTRTQHLKRVDELNANFDKKIKSAKRRRIISIAVLILCLIVTISFYTQGWDYYDLYANASEKFGNGDITARNEINSSWFIYGFSGLFGGLTLLIGLLQYYFMGIGNKKRIKELEKNKERALKNLEDIKKENMLAGTYDASK